MVENSRIPAEKAALLISHPGHELRVHGWLEIARPAVHVLTDGSGGLGQPRLLSTVHLLERAHAGPVSCYGRLPDAVLYEAILRIDTQLFRGLADQLAEALVADRIRYVVGDAAEGRILMHDVWRGVINVAVDVASQQLGWRIGNFEFSLEQTDAVCPPSSRASAISLRLDDAALHRKLAAARGYRELANEVDAALAGFGIEAFRTECLVPANDAWLDADDFATPAYEAHGQRQVAAGIYRRVVRFREHVLPLLKSLRNSQRQVA